MLAEVAGLAVLAAISPAAILVATVFLGAANPHRTVLIYLTGGVIVTTLVAIVVFVALHDGHLSAPHQRQPRYGVRLGLGVLMLLAAAYLKRRGPRQPNPARQGKGIMSRLLASPGPKAAWFVGLLVYTPSLVFISAVEVVAASHQSVPETVLALAIIVVLTLMLAWIPLVFFLAAPDRTARALKGSNAWLRSHGHVLTIGALLVAGVLLTVNGALGLAGVV